MEVDNVTAGTAVEEGVNGEPGSALEVTMERAWATGRVLSVDDGLIVLISGASVFT